MNNLLEEKENVPDETAPLSGSRPIWDYFFAHAFPAWGNLVLALS